MGVRGLAIGVASGRSLHSPRPWGAGARTRRPVRQHDLRRGGRRSGRFLARAPGLGGFGTPSNAGVAPPAASLELDIRGGDSGYVDVYGFQFGQEPCYSGRIVVGLGDAGGTFRVEGFLSGFASAFYGLPASTPQVGTFTLRSARPFIAFGPADRLGSGTLAFGPGDLTAVPEPSTLVSGGIAAPVGLGVARRRRKAKATI